MIEILIDVYNRMQKNDGIFIFTGRLPLSKQMIIEDVFDQTFITDEQYLRDFIQHEPAVIVIKFRWLVDGLERSYLTQADALEDIALGLSLTK